MGFNEGLLWSIDKPDHKSSFILGTIHMNSVFFEKHSQLFQDLISQCDAFAAEVDLDDMLSVPMLELFQIRDGSGWSHLWRKNQFEKLSKSCQKQFGYSLSDYHSFHPILLIHLITMNMLGESQSKSFDQSLWDLAQASGLTTFGLEEIHQHFNVLHDYPISEQLKLLKKLLTQSREARIKLKKMIAHYEKENISFLYKESKRMLGKNRKSMLYERNEIMLLKILKTIPHQKCFYTCGAAHLYGAFGILRKLKNNGFHLKPISLSFV
ncbi:MAG: TraB/GumN family protein [Saprospiraceae bacterium]|nr:TraB/GumN family protein [Saprospiraceae bacterium]